MKNVRLYILLVNLTVLGFACKKEGSDEKFDQLAPAVLINKLQSLKDTFKLAIQPEYTINFSIQDDQDIHILSFSKVDNALLLYDGKIVNDAETNISLVKEGKITFRPLKSGAFSFIVKVADKNGLSNSSLCNLYALGNMPPIALLELAQLKKDSIPYFVALDASKSFDQDGKWGGSIKEYEYAVQGGFNSRTSRKKIEYIFPQAGTYSVLLKVKDNDNEWSAAVEKKIVVE
jgi:hypothetical protein